MHLEQFLDKSLEEFLEKDPEKIQEKALEESSEKMLDKTRGRIHGTIINGKFVGQSQKEFLWDTRTRLNCKVSK